MANYYVDFDGNVTKGKKKKKKNQSSYTVSLDGTVTKNDIAPVKSTTTKKKDGSGWFNTSQFDDGYQFGDVSKAILGTATDTLEHLTSGILEGGEGIFDTFASFSHGMYLNNKAQSGMLITEEDLRTADQIRKDSQELIKKDIIKSEDIAKKLITENVETNWGIDVEKTSVFGEKVIR